MTRQRELAGLTFAALCALNGAFVPAVAKLTTAHADPLFVAAATSLFAAAAAAVVLALRGELALLVDRRNGPRLFAVGALGTALGFGLFFEGSRRASAIEAALCLQSEPVYALLAAWFFLGHRPTVRRVAATAVLLAGIVLALGARGISTRAGVWMILATPLCWQASHVIVLRGLRAFPPQILTGARYVYGGVLLALYWGARPGRTPPPPPAALLALAPLLAFQGIVLSYLGTMVWYLAIARLDLARTTAIVVPAIPVLSLGASLALLGEVPTLRQGVGVVVTAAGMLLYVTAPPALAERERIPSATVPIAAASTRPARKAASR